MTDNSNTSSASCAKKRVVISYDNMSADLLAAFKAKYPKGYADYMGDIFKVEKPDGSFFYAVSLDIPNATYLVKVDVNIDNYEEAENDLFEEDNSDELGEIDDNVFPDDGEEMNDGEDKMDD